tara:strand:+ start:422 stop:778 length:357 start_codon:yes stop_codon:yes gene_type:complete
VRAKWEVRGSRDKEFPIEIIIPGIPYQEAKMSKKLTADEATNLADMIRSYVLDDKMESKTVNEHLEDIGIHDVRHVSSAGGRVLFPLKEMGKNSFITLTVPDHVAKTVMNKLMENTSE